MCLSDMRLVVISDRYIKQGYTHFTHQQITAILGSMNLQPTSPSNASLNTPDAPRPVIDLRSDTVTQPTAAMYEHMCSAALGDDGLDGDPTARALEIRVASMLGKDAGLYVPTATMGNLLAVLTQVGRHGQVAMESTAHMYLTERGGATLSGCMYVGIPGASGEMDLDILQQTLKNTKTLRTELVCMETTHVNAGGAVLPLAHMRVVRELARGAGARVHVDGARIFNAAVALQVPVADVAGCADTVSVCLSKGLSAPAGAVLVGPAETIAHARHLRKMLGGTQRQIGVLAASGIEAVETMSLRLADDHATAHHLSTQLRAALPAAIGVTTPASNIVFIELPKDAPDSSAWGSEMKKRGVLIRPWGERRIRLVTHRHIDAHSINTAIAQFQQAASTLFSSVDQQPT